MVRFFRLMGATFSVSVQRDLAYRSDFVAQVVVTLLAASGAFMTLTAIYSHVHRLAGWRYGQTIVILGSFMVVNGILQTFVEPNLIYFGAAKVRSGNLDDELLKPVPSILFTSLSRPRPQALFDVATGLVILVVVAVAGHAVVLSPGRVASYVLLVAVGVVVTWSLRMVMASVSLFSPGLELTAGFTTVWQLARYPLNVYGRPLAGLLTYAIPLAFVATYPARALTTGVGVGLLAAGMLAALGSVGMATAIWRAGLRRYTSATS